MLVAVEVETEKAAAGDSVVAAAAVPEMEAVDPTKAAAVEAVAAADEINHSVGIKEEEGIVVVVAVDAAAVAAEDAVAADEHDVCEI